MQNLPELWQQELLELDQGDLSDDALFQFLLEQDLPTIQEQVSDLLVIAIPSEDFSAADVGTLFQIETTSPPKGYILELGGQGSIIPFDMAEAETLAALAPDLGQVREVDISEPGFRNRPARVLVEYAAAQSAQDYEVAAIAVAAMARMETADLDGMTVGEVGGRIRDTLEEREGFDELGNVEGMSAGEYLDRLEGKIGLHSMSPFADSIKEAFGSDYREQALRDVAMMGKGIYIDNCVNPPCSQADAEQMFGMGDPRWSKQDLARNYARYLTGRPLCFSALGIGACFNVNTDELKKGLRKLAAGVLGAAWGASELAGALAFLGKAAGAAAAGLGAILGAVAYWLLFDDDSNKGSGEDSSDS
jgi:hypothetical protein